MIDINNGFYTALNIVLDRRINNIMNLLKNKPDGEIAFEEWLDKYRQYEAYKRFPLIELLRANNLLTKLALALRDAEVVIKDKAEEELYEFELEGLKDELGPIRSRK